MNFITKTEKMRCILKKIEEENTGPAEELCKTVYVSIRTLNRYISDLRELGNKIEYSRTSQTYFVKKNSESD